MDSRKVVAVYLAVIVVFGGLTYAGGPTIVATAAANQENLEITDTSLSENTITEGESVTVTADVTSSGSPFLPETYDVNLEIDGEVDQTETVILQGGESTTVTFDRSFSDAGSYDISVNGEPVGTVEVLEPPDLSVTGLSLDPNPIVEGGTVDIQATVENSGGVEGETETELKIDGTVEATKTVTVPAGSTTDVTFSQTFDSPGEYVIQVSDSPTKTLTVDQAAEFEVSEATLSESEIREGESITATGTVRNVGGTTGTYTATLYIDGSSVAEKEVEVDPGESEAVSFDRTFESSGEYSISIGDQSAGTLTVLAPADLTVTDATVTSETVTTERPMEVEATVENRGDLTGQTDVSLRIDGTAVTSNQVEVQGGQSQTVEFTYGFDETGQRAVSVDNESAGTVDVLAPAEFTVRDASISPTTILEGNATTATATVENVGDVQGSFTANLTADGSTVDSETVTLGGGESTTVSFDRQFSSAGSYQIGISGETAGAVTVEAPASFDLRGVSVSDGTILENGAVRVTGTVENTGDRSGVFDAALKIDRNTVEQRSVEIAGGESRQISFTREFESAGSYRISLNDASAGVVEVDVPASLSEVDATANTTRTAEGRPVAVELTVRNTGDRSGEYTAQLRVNGEIASEQLLTVDGRETASVTFTERFDEPGEYRLTFEETTAGTVTVEEPPEFEVTSATVAADFVAPGEPTTVEFEVRNPGNFTATQTVNITADGDQITQERITLGPGERREVVTEFSGTAGEIAVGGTEAGTIESIQETDTGETEQTAAGGSSSVPFVPIVLILVIVAGVAGVYFVDQRR